MPRVGRSNDGRNLLRVALWLHIPNKENSRISEPPEEDRAEGAPGYLYIANISYLAPTKNVVGVYADTREEAETLVHGVYGNQLNFELKTIDIASDDIARAYKKGTTH